MPRSGPAFAPSRPPSRPDREPPPEPARGGFPWRATALVSGGIALVSGAVYVYAWNELRKIGHGDDQLLRNEGGRRFVDALEKHAPRNASQKATN